MDMRTMMTTLVIGMLASAPGCTTKEADDLENANLVDDADAKADSGTNPIFGEWENWDNAGDLTLQYLELRRTNKFSGYRWNVDYCPDDNEESTCSEEFAGRF